MNTNPEARVDIFGAVVQHVQNETPWLNWFIISMQTLRRRVSW